MRSDIPLLASIEIPTPCPMSWATMDGGDTQRFCGSCQRHVHDLSAMTAQEAETLLQTHQGELCVRYTQDSEGRIVTDEFPASLRPLRALVLKHCAMAAAFVLLALTAGAHQASAETRPTKPKTAIAKKTGTKHEPVPMLGKRVVRPAVNPAPSGQLTTKMGEPVARPVAAPVKQVPTDKDAHIRLGRADNSANVQKERERPAPLNPGKESPKPADNHKP